MPAILPEISCAFVQSLHKMKEWEFAGKPPNTIDFIGVFTSTTNQQFEIVLTVAGTLAKIGGLHLQTLQKIAPFPGPVRQKLFSEVY